HGQSPETHFLEREPTERLFSQVGELLESAGDDEVLPALFVLGAPGAGKTTLVRRVAARAVQEGLAVVAAPKLNLERIDDGDVSTLLRSLARLEEGTLPVLLVLDDPLFAESGWDDLLRRLAPRSRRLAVLATSPDYLFHEHRHQLGRQVDVRIFPLDRPRRPEREALALLHGRDPGLFQDREDDFLVLAMEASAGASFKSLVDRLWMTLNHGRPIDPRTRPDELAWLVRAYLVVCYWHRFGMTCPEVVLGAILDHSHRDPLAPSCRYELQRLVSEQGWEVFTVTEPARHLAFLGAGIGASHPRIAAEAWHRRPVPAFDVGEWVARASLAAQPAGVDLGILACRVDEPGLRDRLVELWNRAALDGTLETRNLCLLHAALSLHGAAAAARRLEVGLAACAARLDGQSWLAVLALLHYGKDGAVPPGVDLLSVIRVADLHLAPGRATMLMSALKDSPDALGAVLDRIGATADYAGTGHLLARLVAARPGDAAVLGRAAAWLRSHEGATGTAELLVQLVEASPSDPDLVRDALDWLRAHANHPNVRRLLVPLVDANPTHPELRRWALAWIGENEGWPKAQRVLARLVERSGGDEEAMDLALDWLARPQRKKQVRNLMSALGRALAATPAATLRFLSGCNDENRKKLLLEALVRAVQENPEWTGPLLEALEPLPSRDLSLLLLHLLRKRSEPVESFLAAWLADPRFLEDRGSLLRSIRSKPPLRERLLAREDLAPEVRRQLQGT
ncbi:MAG TPA: hypothetical protein VEL74_21165, partial [Thermoanaerobaculia bacterium]|nr:hypothetical protein [Thermoanaerobaculia bacterium]